MSMQQAESVSDTIDQLRQQHSVLEARLIRLRRGRHLTEAERLEVRRIKRQKLRTKDRIELLRSGAIRG